MQNGVQNGMQNGSLKVKFVSGSIRHEIAKLVTYSYSQDSQASTLS